jgi:hypothetical protein
VSCSPVSFTLRGETSHEWNAEVTANTEYKITVTIIEPNPEMPVNQRVITVSDEGVVISRELIIASDEATITFVAPESGQVKISVQTAIGDLGDNLGTHTIMICEDDS